MDLSLTRPRADQVPVAGHSDRRYPVQLDLRYKVLRGSKCIQEGIGRTSECSSAEVSFTADQRLTPGTEMQLSLDWPIPLDGICPLQLVISGRITRSRDEGTTLKIVRHEFRTRGLRTSALRKPISPSTPKSGQSLERSSGRRRTAVSGITRRLASGTG